MKPSFTKATGRDRYLRQRAKELAEFIDPTTGLLDQRYARVVPCPLCGGNEHKRIMVKEGYTFVRCLDCQLVFANPQVKPEVVLAAYREGSSNDLWIDVLTSEANMAADRQRFGRVLDLIEPWRVGGRLLDVGCSIGHFLRLAADRGWDGLGLEVGNRAVRYAREQMGVQVTEKLLADADLPPGSFDMVACLALLEHLNEPLELLRQVHQILKPGGVLVVSVPNVESLACRIMHEATATFDGRNHLIYFSPRTLTRMLKLAGFEVVSFETQVTALEPILNWLQYRDPYFDDRNDTDDSWSDPFVTWLQAPERRAELGSLIRQLDLGYKITCVARKTGALP